LGGASRQRNGQQERKGKEKKKTVRGKEEKRTKAMGRNKNKRKEDEDIRDDSAQRAKKWASAICFKIRYVLK